MSRIMLPVVQETKANVPTIEEHVSIAISPHSIIGFRNAFNLPRSYQNILAPLA